MMRRLCGIFLTLCVALSLGTPAVSIAIETDKAAATATAEKASGPFAEIVAWITLLDAWGLIAIAIIVACIAWFFYRLQKGESRFNFGDAFIDNTTGQTSYLRIIIFGSFVSAWLVVFIYVMRGIDVQTFVLSILGIFVTNIIANRGFEVFDPRVKAQAINSAPAMAQQPDAAPAAGGTINIEAKT